MAPRGDPPTPAAAYAWAPDRKPNTSFIFYKLKDGTSWVIYSLQDGQHAIVPWPELEDGWDEVLPPSVGIADPGKRIYRVPSLHHTMMYLSQRSVVVRTSGDPAEFRGL